MSGLSNNGTSFRTFVTIFEGKFARKVEPGTPDSVVRMNKNEKEVHELHYKSLEDVYVRGIEKKDHKEYGLSWVITLETDDGQSFDLQIPYSGRAATGFLFRLPNIDLAKPVTFYPSRIKEIIDGVEKFKTYLTVYQFGEKLPQYWTKDDRKDMPEMKQIMVKNKLQWDDTEQMQYLENMLEQYKPLFDQIKADHPITASQPTQSAPAKPAEPVKGVITPLAAIPDSDSVKVEYMYACQAGYKDSIVEYKKMKADYLMDCEAGFTGTIMDYQVYLTTPRDQGVKEITKPAATQPAAKPPMPPVKTAKEKPGTVIMDPLEMGYAEVKRLGYTGTKEEFQLWCDNAGIQPNEPMVNAAGELEFSDLPF